MQNTYMYKARIIIDLGHICSRLDFILVLGVCISVCLILLKKQHCIILLLHLSWCVCQIHSNNNDKHHLACEKPHTCTYVVYHALGNSSKREELLMPTRGKASLSTTTRISVLSVV